MLVTTYTLHHYLYQETVGSGSERASLSCLSNPSLQPGPTRVDGWMSCSRTELWRTLGPRPSSRPLLPVIPMHLISPISKYILVPPLPSVRALCPSLTCTSPAPQPPLCQAYPASGPLGQLVPKPETLFPWSFPDMGLLPPPQQGVPSHRHSSHHCLAHHSYFLHSLYY